MPNITFPILCGGTFFTLILEARKQRTSKRSQYAGELDGLSQPDILTGLGRIVFPEYVEPKNKDTYSTNVSDYKSCENNGTNLSFLFNPAVTAFDNRVKSDYRSALKSMCAFVSRFLDVGTSTAREVWLVKALLDLIDTDQSIDDSQVFYIGADGRGITKAALRTMSDLCLQSFLLGVWHFIIKSRPENKDGKATYDAICPSRGRAERKYMGKLGEGIKRSINVRLLDGASSVTGQSAGIVENDEDPFPSDDKNNDPAKEGRGLVDVFEDAIDQYGIATFVDSDFTAEPLMFDAIVAVDEFVAVMRGTLRKYRRKQDETYRNVIAFVNILEQYQAFLSAKMISDDAVRIQWLPRINWKEVHSFTRGCRRELDRLYGLISGGCSLSINGIPEPETDKPQASSTQTVNNPAAVQQNGNIQIGNNNLMIGSIGSLTINND